MAVRSPLPPFTFCVRYSAVRILLFTSAFRSRLAIWSRRRQALCAKIKGLHHLCSTTGGRFVIFHAPHGCDMMRRGFSAGSPQPRKLLDVIRGEGFSARPGEGLRLRPPLPTVNGPRFPPAPSKADVVVGIEIGPSHLTLVEGRRARLPSGTNSSTTGWSHLRLITLLAVRAFVNSCAALVMDFSGSLKVNLWTSLRCAR